MEELFNSIKAHLYDRTSSPLFGSFCASLAVWNYKFILVLFSSMPIIEKLDYISNVLYSYSPLFSFSHPFLLLFVYPAVTTLIYVKWYPIPAKWFYEKTRTTQKELLKVKQQIEDLTPMPQEEANEIRRDLAKIRIEHGKELKIKDDQIELLNAAVIEKDQQNENQVNAEQALTEREVLKETIREMEVKLENEKQKAIASLSEQALKNAEYEKKKADEMHDKGLPKGLTENQLQLLYMLSTRKDLEEKNIVGANAKDRSKGEIIADLGFLLSKELIYQSQKGDSSVYRISPQGKIFISDINQ